jgi:cytidylate kinase
MQGVIITISREYCSGGRLVGAAVAKELDIPMYDRQLIELAAKKSGLSPDFIENNENRKTSSFLYSLYAGGQLGSAYFFDTPMGDKAFFAEAAVIRDLASKGSCVIVGRCAGYILREDPHLVGVFLHAPLEERMKRAKESYSMTDDDLAEKIVRMDRGRRNYHKTYTGENWSDINSNDIILNTAVSGIEGAAGAILAAAAHRS